MGAIGHKGPARTGAAASDTEDQARQLVRGLLEEGRYSVNLARVIAGLGPVERGALGRVVKAARQERDRQAAVEDWG